MKGLRLMCVCACVHVCARRCVCVCLWMRAGLKLQQILRCLIFDDRGPTGPQLSFVPAVGNAGELAPRIVGGPDVGVHPVPHTIDPKMSLFHIHLDLGTLKRVQRHTMTIYTEAEINNKMLQTGFRISLPGSLALLCAAFSKYCAQCQASEETDSRAS
jgi:hypothetical protein